MWWVLSAFPFLFLFLLLLLPPVSSLLQHEQHREGERQGAGAPVAGRRRRQWWNVFPSVAHLGRVVSGKGSERGDRNGAAKNSTPAG